MAATGVVLMGLLVGVLLGRIEAWSAGQGTLRFAPERPAAVVIGDSQAHGAGEAQLRETWVSQGLAGAGYEPVVLGEAGTGFLKSYGGSPSYLEGLRQGAYTLPPEDVSLVVVEGGGNDEDYPDERIGEAAHASLDLVKEHYQGADIVVVGPLDSGDDPRRVRINELLAQVAEQEDVFFLDASRWGQQYQLDGLFYEDGVHLTEAGHQRLTGPFITQLEALGLARTG
ncbi:SGNH/GDSL hydrolase family protein [Kocuria arenosa]|uniref:SGNH/GDSL hydrolase family protein n=1 Tax=Kocuria arenosa TaxID=3071446 RepID=UPI0034D42D31